MDSRSGWRHTMAARGAYIYERSGHGNIFDCQGFSDCRDRIARVSDLSWGYGKSIVDTIVAKSVGLSNDKTQMVTTDADWEVKKDAVWADRFIEGTAHVPQGIHRNLWDLARSAITLATAATGTAAIRTEPDFLRKCVSHSLRSTLSTFVDQRDSWLGKPLSYFDVTWESPEVLAADPRFKEHRDHILASAEPIPHWMRDKDEIDLETKVVRVITAWRCQFGEFKGREARFVGRKAIQWDDYPHDQPRLAFFRASMQLGGGFWGRSLLQDIAGPLRTVDKVISRTEDALDLLSHTMMAVDTFSTSEESIAQAKNVKIIKYDSRKGAAPTAISVPIVGQDRMQFAERSIQAAHELLGVDQMHTAGRRPEGMTSGRGVRMVASLFSERHSVFQRAAREFVAVDVGRNVIAAALEIGEEDPDWQVTWPGQDFDAPVSVERLKRLNYDAFTLRAYPVSEQKNTPGDRGELANELLANQQITPEGHAILVSTTWDVTAEQKGTNGQRRFFAKLIDTALHADEEDLRDPDFWAYEYNSPPPWTSVADALVQVYAAYWDALVDDVPQYRRDILKRTLGELDAMLTQQQQQEAAAQGLRVNVDATSVGEALGAPAPEQGALAPELGATDGIEGQTGGDIGAIGGAGELIQ